MTRGEDCHGTACLAMTEEGRWEGQGNNRVQRSGDRVEDKGKGKVQKRQRSGDRVEDKEKGKVQKRQRSGDRGQGARGAGFEGLGLLQFYF